MDMAGCSYGSLKGNWPGSAARFPGPGERRAGLAGQVLDIFELGPNCANGSPLPCYQRILGKQQPVISFVAKDSRVLPLAEAVSTHWVLPQGCRLLGRCEPLRRNALVRQGGVRRGRMV